jgi:hypothetical protein
VFSANAAFNNQLFNAPHNREKSGKDIIGFLGYGLTSLDLGAQHLQVKKAIKPFLMSQAYQPIISRCLNVHCERLLTELRARAQRNDTFNLEKFIRSYMFDAIVDVVCGADTNSSPKYFEAWDRDLEWRTFMMTINNIHYFNIIDTPGHKQHVADEKLLVDFFAKSIEKLLTKIDCSPGVEGTSVIEHVIRSSETRMPMQQLNDICVSVFGNL